MGCSLSDSSEIFRDGLCIKTRGQKSLYPTNIFLCRCIGLALDHMNSNNATPLPASQRDVAHRLGHWFTAVDVGGRATYLNVDQRI